MESQEKIRSADLTVEFYFSEEEPLIFSDADREAFLAALDNPPPPNEALKNLLQRPTP